MSSLFEIMMVELQETRGSQDYVIAQLLHLTSNCLRWFNG